MKVASPPTRMKPATGRESKQESHLLGFPGWLGAARVERSAEEPGKPGKAGEGTQPTAQGKT